MAKRMILIGSSALALDADSDELLVQVNPGPKWVGGGNEEVFNKVLRDAAASSPLYQSGAVNVAAGAAEVTLQAAAPPAGTVWLLATLALSAPAGVTVHEVLLDGVAVGAGVVGADLERNLKALFGDYLPVGARVEVVVSNGNAAASDLAFELYGWAGVPATG